MNPRRTSLWVFILLALSAPCLWLMSVFQSSAYSAQGVSTIMDAATFFALLGAIALGVNRALEWLKQFILTPLQKRFGFSDNVYVGIVMLLAFVFSLIGCWYGGANFFAVLPFTVPLPAFIGVILAAGIATSGSAGIHAVTEFLDLLSALLGARVQVVESEARTVKSETTVTSSATGTVQATVGTNVTTLPPVTAQTVDIDMPEAG